MKAPGVAGVFGVSKVTGAVGVLGMSKVPGAVECLACVGSGNVRMEHNYKVLRRAHEPCPFETL